MTELSTVYNAGSFESGVYEGWANAGYFAPSEDESREPFVVIMPPPNVTGELHLGHALFVSVQDLMIRWKRMQGYAALWLPGADHAGIAGQWVVEKQLALEGMTRHDLGREAFLDRIWEFMDLIRGRIYEQMRILGASSDWSRFAFTMDPGPSAAVRKVFKHLYDKGLIYRGERLISWCPRCMTALSDLEVVHREVDGHLWHIAYPVTGGGRAIEVATTRPETMLGDTAVAVHPDDPRYRDLIGATVQLPILNRVIPVVADDSVDMEFGSGAVKVTPAHDPNDFDIGKRHDLPLISVMNTDGTLNDEAGPFAGMTIADGRQAVVERLQSDGALMRVEDHRHAVGHCDRCGTVVEPLVSLQWFVEMAPLAETAAEIARTGELQFVPEHFRSVYLNWMDNIHDWTISRQLWWGHRIPVWYCEACGETIVTELESLDACPACGGTVRQDQDVLDTWFSSGLWPFSTLGWPQETRDLKRFYPSDVMETGYEILFFWVARMVFFGIEMMGEPPFHTVYLHGTVRDAEGLKMSKTKGNVLDPTEITAEYGADALRFALLTQGSPGTDMRLSLPQVEASRNFLNKLWNISRFALRTIDDADIAFSGEFPARPTENLAIPDRWILSRTDAIVADVTRYQEQYQFAEAGRQLRDFVWSELADWYVEATKVRLRLTGPEQQTVAQTLAFVMDRVLRLLHPFIPFATEVLWQALPHRGPSIMISSWPEPGERDLTSEAAFDGLVDLVARIRNARAESGVEPKRWISADVSSPDFHAELEAMRGELSFLARIDPDQLSITAAPLRSSESAVAVVGSIATASLPLAGMVDIDAEIRRLRKELEEAEAEQARATAQLANEAFTSKAPEPVIAAQRTRLENAGVRSATLRQKISELLA